MKQLRLLVTFLITVTLGAMQSSVSAQDFATNRYTLSTEELANPERGFYIQSDTPSSVPSNLASYRDGKASPGGTYTAKITLVLRVFYLDTFLTTPISSTFLNSIQTDFDSIRNQGCKAIVRFAYSKSMNRPFSEPTKAQILAHIQQLKPVLQENSDVIAVVQQGLIGAWGEGFFTDVFYTNFQATTQNWLDRIEVLQATLDAVPMDRMVQVRIPQLKQKFVYGPTAPTSSSPMFPAQAFNGSSAARIGFHNDCFLAGTNDWGTFQNNDVGASATTEDNMILRNYLAQDGRFTPVGGETCSIFEPTDDCGCVDGGKADVDMAYSHYSFLNQGYKKEVNNDWVTQGCIEDIKRGLGYRLQLVSGIFRTEAQPGQALPITFEIQNLGYAALYNPRGIELVLRETSTGKRFFAALSPSLEARRWLPGNLYKVMKNIALPATMPKGDYELLLHLPDPAVTLYGKVPYSIRLANSNALSSTSAVLGEVWDANSGYHRLYHTLHVNGTATNSLPNGAEARVLNFSAIAHPSALTNITILDTNLPNDQTVDVGQRVTFTSSFICGYPLAYQWVKNGANIPGATNETYTINTVQASDTASYKLIASTGLLTNATRTAVLKVGSKPLIEIDGTFTDWQNIRPLYTNSQSGNPSAANLKNISACNDSDFIYMMVTTWNPTKLMASTNVFGFDTDDNSATGYAYLGGSELMVQNGVGYQQKVGIWNAGPINNLQYLIAPTGIASQFEFRISRNAVNANDQTPVFKTNFVNFCFDGENAGFTPINRVPSTGIIRYLFAEPPISLAISCAGTQLTLSWPGSGILQTRSSLTEGNWSNVTTISNPWSTSTLDQQRYFRIAQ